jgi:hypothetical protein
MKNTMFIYLYFCIRNRFLIANPLDSSNISKYFGEAIKKKKNKKNKNLIFLISLLHEVFEVHL